MKKKKFCLPCFSTVENDGEIVCVSANMYNEKRGKKKEEEK